MSDGGETLRIGVCTGNQFTNHDWETCPFWARWLQIRPGTGCMVQYWYGVETYYTIYKYIYTHTLSLSLYIYIYVYMPVCVSAT